MRKLIPLLSVAAVFSFVLAVAAEVKTISGDAVCAKCALGESKTCVNTVTTDVGGKKVTYYLTKNKFFGTSHKALGICGATKETPVKVKVTGDVEEKDGKMTLTPTEELSKVE